MISKTEFTSEVTGNVEVSGLRTTLITAKGSIDTADEEIVYVNDLDMFGTAIFWKTGSGTTPYKLTRRIDWKYYDVDIEWSIARFVGMIWGIHKNVGETKSTSLDRDSRGPPEPPRADPLSVEGKVPFVYAFLKEI